MTNPPAADSTYLVQNLKTSALEKINGNELQKRFATHGAIIMKDFFTDAELSGVRTEMEEYYKPWLDAFKARQHADSHKAASFQTDIIPWDPIKDGVRSFEDLANHEKFQKVTGILLGEGSASPGSLVMFSVPGGRGQAWHQDCPAEVSNAFNLNRLIYTEDVAEEDGGIVFVPGSHHQGTIPEGGHQDPMPGEVELNPTRGTVVFLHGHVFHRVKPNHGKKPRVSVNFRAFPEGVDPDVNCIGVYRTGRINFCDQPKQHDGTPAGKPIMA